MTASDWTVDTARDALDAYERAEADAAAAPGDAGAREALTQALARGVDLIAWAKRQRTEQASVQTEVEDVLRKAREASGDDTMMARLAAAKVPEGRDGQAFPWSPRRRAVRAGNREISRPARLLWGEGLQGAILRAGSVAVVAAEGGAGKSAMALSIALGMASLCDGREGDVCPGLFRGVGGVVLFGSWEDDIDDLDASLRELAHRRFCSGRAPPAALVKQNLSRIGLLDLQACPLFGPVGSPGRGGLYNSRPGPLDGWANFWDEALSIEARLVVIDPVLRAYVGDPNASPQVGEFLAALTRKARELQMGVLLLAHSNKAARREQAGGHGKQDREPDLFGPDQVTGTAAWTDLPRTTLTFAWRNVSNSAWLAVYKSNIGPSKIKRLVRPVRSRTGQFQGKVLGFDGDPAHETWVDRGGQRPEWLEGSGSVDGGVDATSPSKSPVRGGWDNVPGDEQDAR